MNNIKKNCKDVSHILFKQGRQSICYFKSKYNYYIKLRLRTTFNKEKDRIKAETNDFNELKMPSVKKTIKYVLDNVKK